MIMIWWIAKTTLTFEVETWLTPWMVEVSRNSFKTSIALTQPWPMTVVFVFLLCQTIHLIQPTFVNDKSSAFVFKNQLFQNIHCTQTTLFKDKPMTLLLALYNMVVTL